MTNVDALTRTYTAFRSFADLTTGTAPDYRPTLTGARTRELADAYDAEMERRGDARRAFRGIRLASVRDKA